MFGGLVLFDGRVSPTARLVRRKNLRNRILRDSKFFGKILDFDKI